MPPPGPMSVIELGDGLRRIVGDLIQLRNISGQHGGEIDDAIDALMRHPYLRQKRREALQMIADMGQEIDAH